MWRMLERMTKGEASREEVDMLMDVTKQIEGHTICAFGEAAAWPVQGLLRHFKKEVACFGSEDKLCVVLQSGDKTDTKRVVDKLTSLYHIHHTAIRSHCLNSLIYTFSGKKDYQAMGMKVNNENT